MAENVPRLILFAMLASVSRKPCLLSRSASSLYPISALANSAFKNRRARSSQEGGGLGFVTIVILPLLNNISHIRYFPLAINPEYDIVLPYKGETVMYDMRGDNRQQKGLEIAATSKIAKKGGAWLVPSQRGKGRYTVCLDPTQPRCSCPDHEEGGFNCKHIFAVEYVIQRECHSDGSTTVTETLTVRTTRKTYPQDWRAYNAAQTSEKERFLDLRDDLCSGIAEPERQKNGRPPLPIHDALFAACYKIYSTVSGRRFMTDLRDAQAKGYLAKVPQADARRRPSAERTNPLPASTGPAPASPSSPGWRPVRGAR